MAKKGLSLGFFMRLWALSRGLKRSQWRWRRLLGMFWFVRRVFRMIGKSREVESTTVLRPDTMIVVSSVGPPTRRQIRVLESG